MKAIQIKYLAPTNTQGSRLKAFVEGCKPLTVARDYAATYDSQEIELANEYIKTLDWNVKISGIGQIPNGDYVVTLKGVK